ncbi:zinc finger MYM-type protein 2 isoform X2 [Xyrichtys novacula]|uniref:Zinc finger MYM-type protein 2 isoform X2 n=1 Tax=Xyrichtys novacula TaxID=13765 RepID=A0AAV1GZU5_XYRNO|nr:zinc finger MYM-type protein 2 isoform X2 [Xyrichtys novacula]
MKPITAASSHLIVIFSLCSQVVALAMDGESEPNPAVAEEAEEQVEPMDATPSPEQESTPPSEEAGEVVSTVTEDGATKEGGIEDNDDDVVLVGEEAPQPSVTNPSNNTPSRDCPEQDMSTATPSKTPCSPVSSSTSTSAAPKPPTTAAEPIVIDDEEDSEQKDASSTSPAHPGGSSAAHSPGALSSTEPDSEIRIASVTTLGVSSQKESSAIFSVNTPPHSEDDHADMNLMITSVTSLQGGDTAITIAGESQAEENGLQISSAFSLNPDTPPGRLTASFNPGRGSGPVGQLVQNGDTGTHNRADSWISQSASVPRNQKQTGVDSPSPATSLPKPPGQSSSSTSSSGTQPQPRTVKVTCANCKKPLKKGQTAYQRKGSTHLFCSTTCLSAFSHKPAPKKSCTMCKKDITNIKGTIVAQVDSSESFQEFCSTGCLGAYENKQNPPKSGLKTKCTVCGKLTEIRHEVSFKTVTHKICSDACFNVYRRANGLIMNCCEQCGDYLPSRASANHFLLVDGQQKRFCCHNCIREFKQAHSKLASCTTCKTLIKTGEVLHSIGSGGTMGSYCSVNCMNKGKLTSSSFTNTEPTCHFCKRNSLPQYQATLPEGNVLNFCSSQCVTKFQNATFQTATNGQTPLSTTNNTVQLKCNYCRGAFSLKPEILEWEDKVFQFCSKACCEDYKKLHCIVTFCEYCQEEKTLHETVKFSGVKRPFCSEGCKLLFKQDFIRRLGLKCVSCNHCNQLCKRGVTKQLGGMTRDFCSETCGKKFHDWYYKAARCDCCKVQGNLTESVMWRSELKQFCDQDCLLKFYCQQNEPIMVTQKGPENTTIGYEMQGAKLGLVNQGTVAYAGGGVMRDVKNKAVLCKPLTLTKATYCKPHMQSKLLQTDVDDGVKREYIPVPIPVPVFIPMPMNMYAQVTPTPVSLPVPVPVPVFLPTTLQGAEQIVEAINDLKNKVSSNPAESDLISKTEVTTEDQKPDVKPVKVKREREEDESPSGSSSAGEKVVKKEKKEKSNKEDKSNKEEKREKEEEKKEKEEEKSKKEEEKREKEEEKSKKEEEKREKEEEKSKKEAEKREKEEEKSKKEEEKREKEEEEKSKKEEETEEEDDKYDPNLDLEADFPQASDPAPVLEGMDEDMSFSLPTVLAEEKEESAPRPQPRRQGNKRRAVEESSDLASSSSSNPPGKPSERRSLPLKVRYGVHAWKRWAMSAPDKSSDTKVKDRSKPARSKSNLLSLSSKELNEALSRFVREVCRPNGERYSPDSILYLCLGIQQHLHAKGRKDDLFADPCYQQFGEELNKVLKDWQPSVLPDGSLWGRVEEQSLWNSRQLGEQSPAALLRSLVYLNTKYFGLRTVEQHLRLSFANVYGPDTVHPVTKETTVCIRVPSISQDHNVQTESRKRKRKLEDKDQDLERDDDSGGSSACCPVKKHECHLYELYRSKCPASLQERLDVFYVQLDPSCNPDDPLWFSSTPLERQILESLLTRILMVRDIYTDKQHLEGDDEEENRGDVVEGE